MAQIPTGLMAMLAGAGGPAGPGPGPAPAPAVGPAPVEQGGPSRQHFIDGLKSVLDMIHVLSTMADEPAEKATLLTCLQNINKVLVEEQSDQDNALQGKTSPGSLRKLSSY